MKVSYLGIENVSKKWSMPLRNWKPVINQFMIMYQGKIPALFNSGLHNFFHTFDYTVHRLEHWFRQAVESTLYAIVMVNESGAIEMVNSQTEAFLLCAQPG